MPENTLTSLDQIQDEGLRSKFETIVENVPKVFGSGEKRARKKFWEEFQDKGARSDYSYAFYGWTLEGDMFDPKYDIKPAGDARYMFARTAFPVDFAQLIEDCDIEFDTKNVTCATRMFEATEMTSLPTLDFTGLKDTSNYIFNNALSLESIHIKFNADGLSKLDFSNSFDGCNNLQNLVFESTDGTLINKNISLRDCPLLSAQTVLDIADMLSPTVSNHSITISTEAYESWDPEDSAAVADAVVAKNWQFSVSNTRYSFTFEGRSATRSVESTNYAVIDCGLSDVDVYVPTYYKGLPVTSFELNPHNYCRFTSLNFSNLITNIIIPHAILDLRNVKLPLNLQTLEVPNGWNTTGTVENFIISDKSEYFATVDGVLFNKDKTELLAFPNSRKGTYQIPDTVEIIGSNAFECSNLSSIVFSQALERVEDGAFSYSKLTAVTLPTGVTYVGDCAFENNHNLLTVSLPTTLRTLGHSAFCGCYDLESVSLPNYTLTTIPEYAFVGCEALTSFDIPQGVKTVEDSAFSNCDSLWQVTFPDGLTTIGAHAFSQCGIVSVTLPSSLNNLGTYAFYGNAELGLVRAICNVVTIPQYCFSNSGSSAQGGMTIYLSNKLNTIAGGAFGNDPISHIYFRGSQADWQSITIGTSNDGLNVATIHYIESATESTENGTFTYVVQNNEAIITEFEAGTPTGNVLSVRIPSTLGNLPVTGIDNGVFAYSDITSVMIPNSVVNLGNNLFNGCAQLTTVTFEDTSQCIAIPEYCFWGCTALTNVNHEGIEGLPDSVRNIEQYAFLGCSNLQQLTLPSQLVGISSYAFQDCGITSITLPATVLSVSEPYMDWGTDNFTSITVAAANANYASENGILYNKQKTTLICCPRGKSGTITIPNTVTTIGAYALRDCASIESIEIPANVTTIENHAFYHCTAITSIVIPDTVTALGNAAFLGCTALASAIVSRSLSNIPANCFKNCSSLSQIYLRMQSSQTTPINDSAFSGCTSLSTVYCQTRSSFTLLSGNTALNNANWIEGVTGDMAFNGEFAYIIQNNKIHITDAKSATGTVIIPEQIDGAQVVSIEDEAFRGNTAITSVTIPDSVISIGERAFLNCDNLETVRIGEGLSSVGVDAFGFCEALTGVYIKDLKDWCLIDFGSIYSNPLIYAHDLYLNNSKITTLTIPNDITAVLMNSFVGVSAETINIPAAVTAIERDAFESTAARTLNLSDGLVDIGANAFDGAYNLATVSIPDTVLLLDNYAFYNCGSLQEIRLGESVQTVGEAAFAACPRVTSIRLPRSLSTVCQNAFNTGSLASSVTIKYTGNAQGLTNLANSALSGNSLLSTAYEKKCWYRTEDIDSSHVKIIGYDGEDEEVVIPTALARKTVSQIYCAFSSYAGDNYQTIVSVTIPSNVTAIQGAFVECPNLVSVTLPNVAMNIYNSFISCPQLSRNTAGELIIGKHYIDPGTTATEVTIDNTVLDIAQAAFRDNTRLTSLTIQANVTSLPDYLLAGCTNLASVSLPNTVTHIGAGTFQNCRALPSLPMPEGLKSLGIAAFDGCSSASGTVTVPNTVNSLGVAVFRDCSSITKVVLGSSVTSIPSQAFSGCSSLQELNLPAGLRTITGTGANFGSLFSTFNNCVSLNTITLDSNNAYFTVDNGVLYNHDKTEIILCPRNYSGAFAFPETVTKICGNAFANCTQITSFTGVDKDAITSIDSGAFTGLGTANGLLSLSQDYSLYYAADGYNYYPRMVITALPASSYNSTRECYVLNARMKALRYRSSYVVDTLPTPYDNSTITTSVDLSESQWGVKFVLFADYLFYNWSTGNAYHRINLLNIPSTLRSLGYSCFNNCFNYIQQITFQANTVMDQIPPYTFQDWEYRYTLNLSMLTGVTRIANSGIQRCWQLTSLTLPPNVQVFEDCALQFNQELQGTITLPDSTVRLEGHTFQYCKKVSAIKLSKDITNIPAYTFDQCYLLKNIYIPKTVTNISNNAFTDAGKDATATRYIYFEGTQAEWNNLIQYHTSTTGNENLTNGTYTVLYNQTSHWTRS